MLTEKSPSRSDRQQWYQEQAEHYGYLVGIGCERLEGRSDIPQADKNARLAGHFGRLALGETLFAEKDDEPNTFWIDMSSLRVSNEVESIESIHARYQAELEKLSDD